MAIKASIMKPYDKKAGVQIFFDEKCTYEDIIFWADYYEIDNDGCFWLRKDWDGDISKQCRIMDRLKKAVIDKMAFEELNPMWRKYEQRDKI